MTCLFKILQHQILSQKQKKKHTFFNIIYKKNKENIRLSKKHTSDYEKTNVLFPNCVSNQ